MAVLFESRAFWSVAYHVAVDPAQPTQQIRQLQVGPIAVLWFRGSLVELMQAHEAQNAEAVREYIRNWQNAEIIGKQGID